MMRSLWKIVVIQSKNPKTQESINAAWNVGSSELACKNTDYNFLNIIFNHYPLQSASAMAEVLNKKLSNTAEEIVASPVENAALYLAHNGYENAIANFCYK